MAIWIALVSALLAVARPAAPEELPAPHIDRRMLAFAAEEAHALAEQARKEPLPFEVRAVGELLRRYGKAEASGRQEELAPLRADLRRAAADALARQRSLDLEKLQAVQGELFAAALRAWEDGTESADLDELGGSFRARAREYGWLSDGRLLMSETERRVSFRLRWAELTGLGQRAPFIPTLDEWRVYFGFLLEHPEGKTDDERLRKRFSYAAALRKRDPSFPLLLARGVLLYQAGAFQESADAFAAHLGEQPDGPYALRAKNHLLAALARAEGRE